MKKLSILGFEETPVVFKRFSQIAGKKNVFMSIALALAFVLALSSFVFALAQPQLSRAAVDTENCSTMTLVSGAGTKTAGWTATDPSLNPLSAGLYSGGSFSGADVTEMVIPPWVNPATDADFTGSGALWASSDDSWPGGAGNSEGSATTSQWRLFHDMFTLPVGAVVSSANIWYTADNAVAIYANGNATPIATTNDVFGASPIGGNTNFSDVFTTAFTPVAGSNTLDMVVRNWDTESATNPTGLLYKAVVSYCVPVVSDDVTVTIVKYIDGVMATGASANNADFPMSATWDADNLGAGTGAYALSEVGFNDPTPYKAVTSEMDMGADYSTYELTNGAVVGANCATGKPFALQAYTTGNTLALAQAGVPTTTAPAFMNLQSDKYVIVWNKDCSATTTGQIGGEVEGPNGALEVTSIDMIDTSATANGTFADGWEYVFHITAPMNEENIAMKFSDWLRTGGGGTIPVASNMRISSAQANNGGATILLTAQNTYSVPALVMTGDLNLGMIGRQVEVTVEVAIPNGTPVGAYTTNYGVQSTE